MWSKNVKCPYGDDCFTCPCPDCQIPQRIVTTVNRLPTDDCHVKRKEDRAAPQQPRRRRKNE